jgi:serine/threonine protein kinase
MKKALDKNRAPEEMMFSDDAGGNPVSEKIDVYSLGNIFYQFLTGQRIYQGMEVKDAQTLIVEGHAHSIVSSFLNTSDANESQELHINRILSHAIQMCLVREPAKRATAFEVANFLTNEWKIIDLDSSKR